MFELHCKFINQWMLDSVQHLAFSFRISAGKHMLCHPRSIELASIGQSIGAETFHYTLKADAAWFHHLTRKQIIIDKYCTSSRSLADTVLLPAAMPPVNPIRIATTANCNALRMRACHAHTKRPRT